MHDDLAQPRPLSATARAFLRAHSGNLAQEVALAHFHAAMAKNGVSCTRKRKLFSVMGATSQGVAARAVAARDQPLRGAVLEQDLGAHGCDCVRGGVSEATVRKLVELRGRGSLLRCDLH